MTPRRACEVLAQKVARPLTDDQVTTRCTKCGEEQTLAQARFAASPGKSTYRCRKGCMVLVVVELAPGGDLTLDVRAAGLSVAVPPLGSDPNLS